MLKPTAWTFISEDLLQLWQDFEGQANLLLTNKLSNGVEKGINAWQQYQKITNNEFLDQLNNLSDVSLNAIKEETLRVLQQAIEIGDDEIRSYFDNKIEYKTSDNIIALAAERFNDLNSKSVKATVKQIIWNGNQAIGNIAQIASNKVKYQVSFQEKISNIKPRLYNQITELEGKNLVDGVISWATNNAIHGQTVTYNNGRKVSLSAYMEMSFRTEIANVINYTMTTACNNLGIDLFLCTEYSNSAPDHADYQGLVYTTNPAKYNYKYPDKNKIVDGPVFLTTRPNCRHRFIPITLEQAENLESTKKKLKTKKIGDYKEQNYKDLQEQRYNELAIKKNKVIKNNLESIKNNCPYPEQIATINNMISNADSNIKDYQKKQRELVYGNKTLTREYRREKVKDIVKDMGSEHEPTNLWEEKVKSVDKLYQSVYNDDGNYGFIPSSFKRQTYHSDKHSKEFKLKKEEYIQSSKDFFNQFVDGKTVQGFTTENGDIYRYDINNNLFGVSTKDGVIRTYYKPERGIVYWEERIEKYGKKRN